jgi:PD-(D/E)XK nuclease superfamily protein
LPAGEAGLWSELSFRIRRPQGILTGTIDKLLISPVAGGGFEIEIIDFKTNRIGIANANQDLRACSEESISAATNSQFAPSQASAPPTRLDAAASKRTRRPRSQFESDAQQFVLNFNETVSPPKKATIANESDVSQREQTTIAEQVALVASDYQLQMQAYALAVHELLPDLISAGSKIKVTLHFLHPNIEWILPDELLTPESCRAAIDEAVNEIISSCSPGEFPVRPARHCRMCSFLRICSAGRDWVDKISHRCRKDDG